MAEIAEVALVLAADLPEGVDRKGLLVALQKGLAETRRFRRIACPKRRPEGVHVVEARVAPIELPYGKGFEVELVLTDPAGAEVERYRQGYLGGGGAATLHERCGDLGHLFADPAYYPKLQQAKGVSGDLRHPSVRDVDPEDARSITLAALLNGEPRGLINVAEQWRKVAAHTGQVEHLLEVVELLALAGETLRAQRLVDEALDAHRPAREQLLARLAGLRAWRELGPDLPVLLLQLGRFGRSRSGGPELLMAALDRLGRAGLPLPSMDEDGIGRVVNDLRAAMEWLVPLLGLRTAMAVPVGALLQGAASEDEPVDRELLLQVAVARAQLEAALGAEAGLAVCVAAQRGEAAFPRAARAALEAHDTALEGLVELHQAANLRRTAPAAAVEAFARLRRGRREADARLGRALALFAAGRAAEAVPDLEAAAKLGANQAWTMLGHVLAGAPERARAAFDRAVELEPFDLSARVDRGTALAPTDHDTARADLQAALRWGHDDAEVHYNLGCVELWSGRRREAIGCFDRAVERRPGYAEALINRGICRADLGDHERALRDLAAGVKADPQNLVGRFQRGKLLVALGRKGEARADLERVAGAGGPLAAKAEELLR